MDQDSIHQQPSTPQPPSPTKLQPESELIVPPVTPTHKPHTLLLVSVVIGFLLLSSLMAAVIVKNNQMKPFPVKPYDTSRVAITPGALISPTTISVTPKLTVTNNPTLKTTVTTIPVITSKPTSTPIPTNTPTAYPTPTRTPTPSPTSPPTPTPTRSPSPPNLNITFPDQGQIVTQSNSQICVVDVPAGGDFTGIMRKQNINGSGWTGYASPYLLCFMAQSGANTFSLQYKNAYNEESPVYTRDFTYQP